MDLYPAILLLILAGFVALIAVLAGRAAQQGRRYIGTDDPIEQYEERADSNWALPWLGFFPWGQTGRAGWRTRIRMQMQREAAEHEDQRREDKRRLEKERAHDHHGHHRGEPD